MNLASRVQSLEDRLFTFEVSAQRLTAQVEGFDSSEYQVVEDSPLRGTSSATLRFSAPSSSSNPPASAVPGSLSPRARQIRLFLRHARDGQKEAPQGQTAWLRPDIGWSYTPTRL